MTTSDKAKKWVAENQKAFECWNRHVKEHGLPLAQFNNLGREPEHDAGQQWAEDNREAIEHGLPLQKDIPEQERWLHTPEMKGKLARADAWMRVNPARETDLAKLVRKLKPAHSPESIDD